MELANGVSLPLAEATADAIDFASADAPSCIGAGPKQPAAALQPPQLKKRSRSPRGASREGVAVRTRMRNKQSPAQTSEALAPPSALIPTDVGVGPDILWTAMCQETFELLPQRQRYMKVYNKFSWWMRSTKRQLVKPGDDVLLQQGRRIMHISAVLAGNTGAALDSAVCGRPHAGWHSRAREAQMA